jgi:hypothetical protein
LEVFITTAALHLYYNTRTGRLHILAIALFVTSIIKKPAFLLASIILQILAGEVEDLFLELLFCFLHTSRQDLTSTFCQALSAHLDGGFVSNLYQNLFFWVFRE